MPHAPHRGRRAAERHAAPGGTGAGVVDGPGGGSGRLDAADNACWHHDFGYRNYRADFRRHKDRIDEVFRADLRRICDGHTLMAQPFCNSIAFTYYEAVRLLVNT